MYVIGLNGPPEAGKDSIAKALTKVIEEYSDLPIRIVSLVEPLARMGATLLGVKYSDEWYVATKPVLQPLFTKWDFTQDTFREWMIRMTEDFFKPRYGETFWTQVLLAQQQIDQFDGILIVTNIGFQYEANLFEDSLGSDNVCIVQVDRAGKNFDIDSSGPVQGVNTLHLFNSENLVKWNVLHLWELITKHMTWNLK